MIGPANGVRARRTLPVLLLGLLFFGPLLIAFALYYGSDWRPAGHTNHGTLIQPPRALPGSEFVGKWSLVYVGPGDCDADCRRTLYFMRQTHLGLGSLATRVQRVFVVTARCCDRAYLAREQAGLVTLTAADATHTALLHTIPADGRATSVFIVDPRGNLMMRYDAGARPEGFLDDLKNLLALSSIG